MLPLTRVTRVRPPNTRTPHPERHKLDRRAICLQFRSKGTLTTRYYGTRLPLEDVELNAFEMMHLHEVLEKVMSRKDWIWKDTDVFEIRKRGTNDPQKASGPLPGLPEDSET